MHDEAVVNWLGVQMRSWTRAKTHACFLRGPPQLLSWDVPALSVKRYSFPSYSVLCRTVSV